jgi:glycosyltransferase involved in cell wall biosynthesis
MGGKYSVAAIIAVYNGADLIRRSIDSVLAQTRAVDELIVIDDGSTDSTGEIVSTYGRSVRYIYQKNSGVAAARNQGARSSTSEWVGFLDHDDEWLPSKIERQLVLLEANPTAALCYTAHRFHALDGARRVIYRPKEKLWPAIRLRNPFPPSVALIRKRELLASGGFDEELRGASCEDWDFFVRFLSAYCFVGTPEPLVNYYEAPTSCSRNYRTMLPNTLSIVDKSLLCGLSGISRALWRRRIKSMLYYRAAISALELGDPAARFLLASLAQWPLPDLAPKRFKTVLSQLKRNYNPKLGA